MATVQDIAREIVSDFDRYESTTVERAAARAIAKLDLVSEMEASIRAEAKSGAILLALGDFDARALPFEFSDRSPHRLIGKQRERSADSDDARRIRKRLHLVPEYLKAIVKLGDRCFEFVSAASLTLAGASESFATEAGDEGGIDIYGRLPIRPASATVPSSILATSILERDLLFFGQSKCIGIKAEVGRGTITQFNADVDQCRQKYEGVKRKPSHRVPATYYRTGETCLRVFLTTGIYSPGAINFAVASDIALVNGRELAEFLLFHSVGLRNENDLTEAVDPDEIARWSGWK